MDSFIGHWTLCNTALAPGALVLNLADNVTMTLAQFTALRATVQSRQTAVQARLIDAQIARGAIDLLKGPLLQKLNAFNDAMVGFTQTTGIAILDAYDFAGIGMLVDVGGGVGHLLAAILAKYPKLKVELSLYAPQEMVPKSVAALDAGNPPDVAYGDVYDFQVTAKWAYEGRLEDISSIIDPLRAKFEPAALSTTFLYNNSTQSRAYYAFPIKQQTMHIQYWKDMLADAGFKESDIPKDWKGYWSFWCEKVQPAYRQKSGDRTFGIGQPLGVDSSDSFYSFLTFMDAYSRRCVFITYPRPDTTQRSSTLGR